ncbi:MAG: DNA alkylation repair protein [Candidatus Methanoplasma sp.]|jgi:3-methyladenine DNA glycosylase AlkD|nr:DNA alkylation repair protein [Candidatus Methanoplasma sp.]
MDIRKELTDNADSGYREFHTGIIPGTADVLGVRVPVIRNIAKKICADDWRSFLSRPTDCHEERVLKALVIANAKMSFDERLELTKEFVPEIGNWAVCDLFCGDWKVKAAPDREVLWDYCLNLIETGDEFKMRISAVMMLNHFLDDEHIDDVLRILTTSYNSGYYYKMGAAWTLSYCYIKYPKKTEPLLFSESLNPEIRNKTVQKISDSFRVTKEDKERLKAKKKAL